MRKRILFVFAILAVMSMAIAAFAYGGLNVGSVDDKVSCCKKDSCPMKGHQMSAEHAKGEHKNCDCCKDGKCTGDSCPMKKNGKAKAAAVSISEEGESCCDNCDCCKAKAKTETASV